MDIHIVFLQLARLGGIMKLKSLVSISSAIFLSAMFLASCTSMITEEQMLQLQDLRKKERTLNQDISNKQTEISKIEKELNARKAEADNCNKETEFVKQKLSQWPNVWPDYIPNENQETK